MRAAVTAAFCLLALCAGGASAADEDDDEPAAQPGLSLRQDATVLPAFASQPADARLRWWLRHGQGDLGFGLRRVGSGGDVATWGRSGWQPTLSVGWHSSAGHTSLWADARAHRGDLGVEWTPARQQLPLGLQEGLLGVRLDAGYRLSLRPRKGGLGVYVKGQF